jgi:serine/threonine-protein phosphatase PGAM5
MSWQFLKPFYSLTCYTVAGASLYMLAKKEKLHVVENSSKNDKKFSDFDLNWDYRAETSIVKPLKEDASSKRQKRHSEKLEKEKPKAVRHLLLIRHGQYFLRLHNATDADRFLTKLGREQAKMTGARLKELDVDISNVVVSTMKRAQETADIILSQLPNGKKLELSIDAMLEEGAPIGPEPKVGGWKPMKHVRI